MALQFSTAVRNAMLDAIETATGPGAKLRLYSGAAPANPAAAATGTMLVGMALPADWMASASGGSKALSGTWQATGAAAGTVGHYRIVDNAGTTCHEQGSVTATGGGGDLTLDNTSIAAGQTVTITSKTLTAPNA
ncbi:hypothetical protein [Aquariibacter albus]|uniref:Uncharacterized protein n=1 Tax=Aquariibacter albus TaxID=2759899 RepID=A0A839HKA3_9BURK|nr:hypothetical protein [Aquariibacter albus]MBB1161462.1 hypothetical protein [Aquariibacter albus]